MADAKAPWPTDDPCTPRLRRIFSPKGFLVAILVDPAVARASTGPSCGTRLCRGRLARLNTCEQILDIHVAHVA